MDELASILGQTTLAAEIAGKLALPSARVWIQGGSGTGKSTVAKMLGNYQGELRQIIRVSGDSGHGDTKYLAIHRALSGTRRSKKYRDAVKNAKTAPLLMLPYVGSTAAEFAKIAIASQENNVPDFLTAEQQDILQGLQNISRNKHLILIVDDIMWLDDATARLIIDFNVPEVQNAYPFARNVSVLFIENTDAKVTIDEKILSKLRSKEVVKLHRVSRDNYAKVLNSFGLKITRESDIFEAIYSISHGHLEIAKQISQEFMNDAHEQGINSTDLSTFMGEILSKKIENSRHGEDVKKLLNIGACIGTAFSKTEVQCAYKDETSFSIALLAAINDNLFLQSDNIVRFSHESVRAAAERFGSVETKDTHSKILECLSILRPGDYVSRLKHARLAENDHMVNELSFVVSLQHARGESVISNLIYDVGPLDRMLADSRRAYRFMDNGEHALAIETILPHYTGHHSLSQGEIVSIIALNYIKLRTNDAYSAAIGLLEYWQEWREEAELWQRLMSILMAAWVANGEMDKATRMYTLLAEHLMRRHQEDSTARTRVESLNRKADQFFTTEISIKHIQRAANWFGPECNSNTPRHAFEYTASLVNLSAAKFTLGQYSEASEISSLALQWIHELRSRGLRTTESYKALNNYAISSFRANIETADAAENALSQLLSADDSTWELDRSLLAINRAALLLISGHTEQACIQLEKIYAYTINNNLDCYYRYYSASNLSIALALSGEISRSVSLIETAKENIHTIPRWYRSAHELRLALLSQAIKDSTFKSAIELDGYPLQKRTPLSNQDAWWSIGRGLLLSDIQVWSEG